mmetsp:Transcript_17463/g.35489  ORF Transcript_17463/g.35489 Transcript_17463/m.35489 type:complete len:311 (-) Transcript_17463:422-1354(-)
MLVAKGRRHEIDDNAGEVHVGDYEHVELLEEGQFADGALGELVCRHRLLQPPNLPYDGEHDGAAARDVHQVQNIRPRHVPLGALGGGRDEEDGDVVHHLEEKDGEDHLFLLGGKEGLEERPATSNEQYNHEKQHPLQEREQVVEHTPRLPTPRPPRVPPLHGVGEDGEGLDEEEEGHEVVDVVDAGGGAGRSVGRLRGPNEAHPGCEGQRVAEAEERVDEREGLLALGEVVDGAGGVDIVEVVGEGHGDLVLVVVSLRHAPLEGQVVQALVLLSERPRLALDVLPLRVVPDVYDHVRGVVSSLGCRHARL